MQSAHCALAVALKYASDDPDFAIARQYLETAIALSKEYHQTYWSIFWNTSTERTKRRIRTKCHQLAFDTYSNMIELADLVNKYADYQTSRSISPPKSWQEFLHNLECAFLWIEDEHSHQIYFKQLSLIS
ncbi:hypothetical protein [Halotia branconii]|uniref:Uncharacterized protein n=1 Tax=Halotia branconii CENA392 TaxID=1539056 RepID=A0AAJ6NPJ7_9CYAN|nr:hypothetical protein [Halotia branconii]WGV24203.1 hypothetical protein QI031_20700 [Halotia branconii CENA392]